MHIKHDRELIKLHQDIVETLIHTIDFMRINSAVLAPQPHGGFALVPKTSQVDFYTIQCRPWAPLIDIREVRTTRWCADPQIEVRQGLWRGREIEFFVACGTGIRVAIQRYTDLLQALNACGLDLCSPVVGHLVKDGSVIGVATEVHTGLATYADRALLYDAFQQLERENIFFKIELCPGSIYISDGKVRFGYLCASRMRLYSGREGGAFLEEARQIHWSCLDDFLSTLEDEFFSTFMPIRWNEQFRILAYIPTPSDLSFLI
ncbi:hypothetical protein BDZ89DRAFT_442022 [Hymenopellis radicata]|nr:hypothetical protein BDZ89DRAFT_442022 [Hymenopellis radicata]